MSSLPPNTAPPPPVPTPSSRPNVDLEDWDQYSSQKFVKSKKHGNEGLSSFRGVSLEPDRFSVRCGLEGIYIPGRRWRRKIEIIQPIEIHSFAADCNTDDLLCVQIKNVSPAHAPDIVYAVLVSCRCNYTESKLFFKQRTNWRPRISRHLMISVASEMSSQNPSPNGRVPQLPVQVLTLQASNLLSEDLTLTVLAPTSFTSPPSVLSLTSAPSTPMSPFVGHFESSGKGSGERRISSMLNVSSASLALENQRHSGDGGPRTAAFNEQAIPISLMSQLHGTSGRSSVSGIISAVFGATGFLGRYLAQRLAKMGSQVLVPFRGSEDSHRHLKLMGDLGQIVPMKYNPRDENSIKAVMAKANVVINLIGREYETRNYSFEERLKDAQVKALPYMDFVFGNETEANPQTLTPEPAGISPENHLFGHSWSWVGSAKPFRGGMRSRMSRKTSMAFVIYADVSICLDILQNQWSPIYDVAAILTSIQVWPLDFKKEMICPLNVLSL
ncbi:hypothetical protein LOK49_LG10G00973 [Camellia lanceoleosa]|uniref:Uncharacterized protein n=1 Tax=Camellia lanceoleosa TaxID=1840588 RepID=A0ACC0GA71_9ERIC|nr:hypothetical protein LOK49_LG10G00973 [Camellia lanceoleosa]